MATEFGYTGKMLRVDLSSGNTSNMATADYADRFLGGRGIAAKIYWDEVSPETKAFDPENRLLFVTGPLTGVDGLASSRVQVCAKSPVTKPEQFGYANLGGDWGAYLKLAGYDGIIIQGKAEKPVYLFLHDGVAEVRDASHLWGKGAMKVREELKDELGSAIKVIATGPAGDNMVIFATLLADNDSSGSSGLGAVMGSKRLKAIAVSGSGKVAVANPGKLQELTRYILELKMGPSVGQPREAPANPKMQWEDCWGCPGCNRMTYKAGNGQQGKFICQPQSFYQDWAGQYYGKQSDVPFYATKLCDDYGLDTKAMTPLLIWFSRCQQAGSLTEKNTGLPLSRIGSLEFIEALARKTSLRDGFGDILAQGLLRAAALVGGEASEPMTDSPQETEIRATEQLTDFPFKSEIRASYDPRMYITTGLLYMVEPRPPVAPVHEVAGPVVRWLDWVAMKEGSASSSELRRAIAQRFLGTEVGVGFSYLSSDVLRAVARKFFGGELAVDFSTYEGKALAAKIIQDREYAKECLILCDRFWPLMFLEHSADHLGDSSLESKLLAAVTGKETDENELYRLGERVFNLQRAILAREGHQSRENDTIAEAYYTVPLETDSNNPECLVPGKEGEVITKKGAVVDRAKFEKLKDEYYALRGWDVAAGRQTTAMLSQLGLQDIARELVSRGLIAEGPKVLV